MVERKGKYALVPPAGDCDWWQINDTDLGYAVLTVQTSVACAEEIARFAWSKLA